MYGDLLPMIGVQNARELSEKTNAQNRTVERAMERKLRAFYLQKRQTVLHLESEAKEVYKQALKRYKNLKISTRERRRLQPIDRNAVSAPSFTESQPSFTRKTSVLEITKENSQSGLSFRKREISDIEKENHLAIADNDFVVEKPVLDDGSSVTTHKVTFQQDLNDSGGLRQEQQRKMDGGQEAKIEEQKTNVLPPIVSNEKLPRASKKVGNARVQSTLMPIPEDSDLGKMERRVQSVQNEKKSKKKSKKKGNCTNFTPINLPSVLPFVATMKNPNETKRQQHDKPWRTNMKAKEDDTLPPLVHQKSQYIDWMLEKDGVTFTSHKITYAEPGLNFFSYEPMLKREQRMKTLKRDFETDISFRVDNFNGQEPELPTWNRRSSSEEL